MKKDLAPVVVFCYNRPLHLKKTIESLKDNALASESVLYVFSDGHRGDHDRELVLQVRSYLESVTGFKEVVICNANTNRGLSKSVIEGVTKVVEMHGKVIVLEDDMITSVDFLSYMNALLDAYERRKDIFSVTGYSPPIKLPVQYRKDLYLAPRASSWGWGTWSDRWFLADWDMESYQKLLDEPDLKENLIRGGSDLWPMLVKQQKGFIDSWAVRWCLTQALRGAYGLYPVKSKVKNIGTDGTGTNFTFNTDLYDVKMNDSIVRVEADLAPDEEVVRSFGEFYDLPFYIKIKNLLKYGIRVFV